MIPYGRQDITQADIDAVVDVLRSDYLTQGPMVPRFEHAVATHVSAKHAVAVNSATSALHIACMALDLGPGDWLWTTPVTFVASANCGLYCGAQVDFVDIDPRTYNLCPQALARKLEAAERAGTLPKVVIPVHFGGQSCDMEAVGELSAKYGFHIIEDASHAIGGSHRGVPIGACRHSDVTIFSFHPVKIITSGEGGMAVTNDADLAGRMASLRSHGITRDPAKMTHAPDGPWYYQQTELGFNYRLTDIQAALGVSQLRRLEEFVRARRDLARRYDALIAKKLPTIGIRRPDPESAYHLYVVRVPGERRDRAFRHLRDRGVGVNLHYIPVHLQPYYEGLGFRVGQFPEAEGYYREAITLPMFPAITRDEQDIVISVLAEALT